MSKHRGKLTKKTRSKSAWLLFIGHLASWLCLVHCLATVILTFVAPSLLKLMPHNFLVELAAWIFVLISSLFLLSRAPKRKWHTLVFGFLFVAGSIAVILHYHNYFAACFMGLALFQLYLTLRHHFNEHAGDDECCQHPHHAHHHKTEETS